MRLPLRVGVVGLGQGIAHVRGFQYPKESTVVALCALEDEELKAVGDQFNVPLRFKDYDEMLEEADLDVVVLATPDHLHGKQILKALNKGKHVLSEIPLATKFEEMRQVVDAVKQTGLKYQMGNQVRYAPCVNHAKRLRDSGSLGELFYGEGEYIHNSNHYRIHSGKGWDNWRHTADEPAHAFTCGGLHAVDTLRYLMDDVFVEVQAYGDTFVYPEVKDKDLAVALYKTAKGKIAKCMVSGGIQRPYCLYYSLYGTKGSFERSRIQEFFGVTTTNYVYFDYNENREVENMIPVPVYNWTDPLIKERASHGTMEIAQAIDFVDAIVNDRPPLINVIEAARSSAAAMAAHQAMDEHRIVEVPQF
jgi:predicted dehydrogenase